MGGNCLVTLLWVTLLQENEGKKEDEEIRRGRE